MLTTFRIFVECTRFRDVKLPSTLKEPLGENSRRKQKKRDPKVSFSVIRLGFALDACVAFIKRSD